MTESEKTESILRRAREYISWDINPETGTATRNSDFKSSR